MHSHEKAILKILKEREHSTYSELSKISGLSQDKVMWSIESLKTQGMVSLDKRAQHTLALSDEGRNAIIEFPEEALVARIGGAGIDIGEADRIGLMWAKRNRWIEIEAGKVRITELGAKEVKSKEKYILRRVLEIVAKSQTPHMSKDEDAALAVLIKRGMVVLLKAKSDPEIKLTQSGHDAKIDEDDKVGALTHEIITTARWKESGLRRYAIDAPTDKAPIARLHPMREFMDRIRETWFSMGFTEVSGPIIESSFWNFDALFSPQDHPTRDMQDTFFLKNPEYIDINDREAVSAVSSMHKKNWRTNVSASMQRQAVLRTHTTNISAHHIRKFAKSADSGKIVKLFSIGRVFRNENIDYKHLAEIIQTEGIIIGDNLSFSNLFDALISFYEHMGIRGIRFRPSYFPFTEPSIEMYRIKDDGTSIEIGGAGMIREEIAHALGTSKDILAWGLGTDRMLMQQLGASSLSEMYTNDIGWLRRRVEIM